MGIRRWQDTTGDLKRVFNKVREKYPKETKHFTHLKTNLVFRHPPATESDGADGETTIAGYARKCSTREKDLYGWDAEIEIASEIWEKYDEHLKFRVMWHEMNHIQLEYDEAGAPMSDSDGRLKPWIKPHDVLLRTFIEEASIFGLSVGELKQLHELLEAHDQFLAKRARKEKKKAEKAAAKVEVAEEVEEESEEQSSGRVRKKKRDRE